jgi:hypothetical protein
MIDDEDKKVDDEAIEVEVEEAVEETVQPEVEDKPVEEPAEETTVSEEQTKKPSKFQKRIDDLVHKSREAERQRDEYYRVASRIMEENNSLRKQAQEFSSTSVEEMEARINADVDAAKLDFKKAYEDGDADKMVEAQDRMLKANAQTSKLERMRTSASPENFVSREQTITPPPDTRAVEWASRNAWFQKDNVMTNAAYAIHDDLIGQGVNVGGDDYYQRIDQRMREEFPHKFKDEEMDSQTPARKGNVAQVVTPGGNDTGRSKKVRLTPSQVAVANRLGVPIEEYAKQFVALDK